MKRIFLLLVVGVLAMGCNNDSPSAPYFEVSQDHFEIWFDESDYSVAVKSSDTWSATSDCDWITVKNPNGKSGKQTLTFSVTENNTGVTRNGSITVQSAIPDMFGVLTIEQYDSNAGGVTILYTTVDRKAVTITDPNLFTEEIVSNVYENGVGTITFNRTVTSVGAESFYGNETLETVTLPKSVSVIGDYAFASCVYLTSINIPERVTTIGSSAFAYCNRLEEITLPNSVETVGDYAFSGCSSLSNFKGKFASSDNRCLIIDGVLAKFAPNGISTYTVEDGVKQIGADAFYESFSLKEVTIPASVESIGDYAFYYCESLEKVYCKSETPPTLGVSVFDNSDNGEDKPIGSIIYVPQSSVEAYKSAENWNKYSRYIGGYNFEN